MRVLARPIVWKKAVFINKPSMSKAWPYYKSNSCVYSQLASFTRQCTRQMQISYTLQSEIGWKQSPKKPQTLRRHSTLLAERWTVWGWRASAGSGSCPGWGGRSCRLPGPWRRPASSWASYRGGWCWTPWGRPRARDLWWKTKREHCKKRFGS